MVVGPLSNVVCLSHVADFIAVIADLVINDILAVAVCITFDFPGAFFCLECCTFLKIHFADVAIISIAEEYTTFDVLLFCDESGTGDLGQDVGWLSACVNEINVFERLLDPFVPRVLDEVFGDVDNTTAVEIAEEC